MTYDQILVFHKIVEEGSFKGAANVLHKTQPAISFAIKKLEEELEIELFDRTNYRPVLTSYGQSFYERSQKLIQSMGELEELSLSFKAKEEAEISLAVDGISPLPDILKVIKEFQTKTPFTRLNLSLEILSAAETRVLNKDAQIGITSFISRPKHFEIVPVTKVKLLPVISKTLLKEKKITSQQDLCFIDQIVVSDSSGINGTSFGILEGGRRWRINDSKFKSDIIHSGLGWGHLPEHEVSRDISEGRLKVLEFEDIHPRQLEINLIRLKHQPLGIVGKALWDRLKAMREE